jgi:uncharacterized circularly permuted ATP-grasp superfamily protein
VEPYDEAIEPSGRPRPLYARVWSALAEHDLERLRERVQAAAEAAGVTFGPGRTIDVDPVPRLISAEEWDALAAGLRQRLRALNAFIADVYGPQRIFDAGVVPRRLLETSPGYEPAMRGVLDPDFPAAVVAGLDLIRDPEGVPLIVEDNLRMPSGAAYAVSLREAVEPALGAAEQPRPLAGYLDELGRALREAAPGGGGDPAVVLLSDGPSGGAWFEHARIGRALAIPVVEPGDLGTDGRHLFARVEGHRRRIDVAYRRLEDDRLTGSDGAETPLGSLLLPALRAGTLRCVNALGTGVADDKLAHAHSDAIVRFYLGEEPLLRPVPAFDLGEPGERAEAMDRIDELVVKPREGFGGNGITIMPRADEDERRRAVEEARRRPDGYVAQETVPFSRHPTVCDGGLRPRHVDLRPFVISTAAGATAMEGGLTRYATEPGEMVVNSSQGGGCKDTWVVEAKEGR